MLISFIFSFNASMVPFVADLYDKTPYCESKKYEGLIITNGDIQRMMGLSDGVKYKTDLSDLQRQTHKRVCKGLNLGGFSD